MGVTYRVGVAVAVYATDLGTNCRGGWSPRSNGRRAGTEYSPGRSRNRIGCERESSPCWDWRVGVAYAREGGGANRKRRGGR